MEIHVASTQADHDAVEAVRAHHAQMEGALAVRVATLHDAVRRGGDVGPARDAVVTWAREELLPHAGAEEGTLYAAAAARPEGRLLVEALVADHRAIGDLVQGLETSADGVAAASAASALAVLVGAHVEKENAQVLPLLAGDPTVSVSALLEGMHGELVGHHDEPAATGGGCGGHCTCGEQDASGDVELDARAIDHAIRHATIFGALDGLAAGRALVLVAPHDPVPLLAQLEERSPGAFEVSYLDRGPEAWRVRLLRRAA